MKPELKLIADAARVTKTNIERTAKNLSRLGGTHKDARYAEAGKQEAFDCLRSIEDECLCVDTFMRTVEGGSKERKDHKKSRRMKEESINRAMKLLTREQDILEDLKRRADNHKYYVVVVEVPSVPRT